MAVTKDPVSGLEFYELSHPWGMYTPIFPGYEEIKLERLTHHAKHGVMTHAPGLSKKAAEWLVKKKVKLVGVDTACVDHPLATSLGPHRNEVEDLMGMAVYLLTPASDFCTGQIMYVDGGYTAG